MIVVDATINATNNKIMVMATINRIMTTTTTTTATLSNKKNNRQQMVSLVRESHSTTKKTTRLRKRWDFREAEQSATAIGQR